MLKNGWYIDTKGIKTKFEVSLARYKGEQYTFVLLANKNIVDILIPENLNVLVCSTNKIKELILPDSITEIWCQNNNIKSLKLNKNIKVVSCDYSTNIENIKEYINNKDVIIEYK